MKKHKSRISQVALWIAFLTTFVGGQDRHDIKNVMKPYCSPGFVTVPIRVSSDSGACAQAQRDTVRTKSCDAIPNIPDFSFDGRTNCPLTIMLIVNFAPNGAMQYLGRPISDRSEEPGRDR